MQNSLQYLISQLIATSEYIDATYTYSHIKDVNLIEKSMTPHETNKTKRIRTNVDGYKNINCQEN